MAKLKFDKPKSEMKYVSSSPDMTTSVTIDKIKEFKDAVIPGDVMDGRRVKDRVVIFEKHTHGALTDKGWISWVDLYMYNVKNETCSSTDYTFYYRR